MNVRRVSRFDLGHTVGSREAYGLATASCSASEVEILRRIRDEKMYLGETATWDEFCTRYLHMARRSANRQIAHLAEFGTAFFTIRHLTHVSVTDYRRIAANISEKGVQLDGKWIPFDSMNTAPLLDAVAELLRRTEVPQFASTPRFQALLKRCRTTAEWLQSYDDDLDPDQLHHLASAVAELRQAAFSLGLEPSY